MPEADIPKQRNPKEADVPIIKASLPLAPTA
jgi:hypothetical protein